MAFIRNIFVLFCWIVVGYVRVSSAEVSTAAICYSDIQDVDDCGGNCPRDSSWGYCIYDCSRSRDKTRCTIISSCFFVLGLVVGSCVAGILYYIINKQQEKRQAKTLPGSDSPIDVHNTPQIPCSPSDIQPRSADAGTGTMHVGGHGSVPGDKVPLKMVRARDGDDDGYDSMTSSRTVTTSVMTRNSAASGMPRTEW